MQSLIPQYTESPRYGQSNSGKAEVDFILQSKADIIPVEIKASGNTSGQSLSQYIKNYSPEKAIVISSMNISVKGAGETEIIHLPHPVAEWLRNLTPTSSSYIIPVL